MYVDGEGNGAGAADGANGEDLRQRAREILIDGAKLIVDHQNGITPPPHNETLEEGDPSNGNAQQQQEEDAAAAEDENNDDSNAAVHEASEEQTFQEEGDGDGDGDVLSPLDVGRIARASRPGTAQPRPASAGGVKGLETVAETHAAPSAASSISSNPCAGMLREHNTRPSRLRPQSAAAAPGRRGPLPQQPSSPTESNGSPASAAADGDGESQQQLAERWGDRADAAWDRWQHRRRARQNKLHESNMKGMITPPQAPGEALRDRLDDLRAAIEMEEAARATLMQANSNAALTWDPTANAEEEAPPVRRMRPSTAPSRRPDPEGLRLQRLQEAMRGDGLM